MDQMIRMRRTSAPPFQLNANSCPSFLDLLSPTYLSVLRGVWCVSIGLVPFGLRVPVLRHHPNVQDLGVSTRLSESMGKETEECKLKNLKLHSDANVQYISRTDNIWAIPCKCQPYHGKKRKEMKPDLVTSIMLELPICA